MLPALVLLLSLGLVAYFYRLLPPEVAYLFKSDGSPKSWLGRETVVLLLLLPQLLLSLTAGGISWIMTRLSRSAAKATSGGVKPTMFISLMGNMIALPQIILVFVMFDVFSYNIYEKHLVPIWLFALIVMLVGGIILAIFFIKAFWQNWVTTGRNTKISKGQHP